MFRCPECKQVSKPGEHQHRVAVGTRRRTYPERRDAYAFRRERKRHKRDDRGGQGWEIAHEVPMCGSCAGRHAG